MENDSFFEFFSKTNKKNIKRKKSLLKKTVELVKAYLPWTSLVKTPRHHGAISVTFPWLFLEEKISKLRRENL